MRFSAFCEYTYDEEGHRFAEYGICCKTGSTDVKNTWHNSRKERNQRAAGYAEIRQTGDVSYTIYNRRFYNAEVQRHIVR